MLDPCASNPCQNGGYCSRRLGVFAFDCLCAQGYTGLTCLSQIDVCTSSPCLNGGTCLRNGLTWSCVCAPGYTGYNCNYIIRNCFSNPCLNGGVCTDSGVNLYVCSCPPGLTGTR